MRIKEAAGGQCTLGPDKMGYILDNSGNPVAITLPARSASETAVVLTLNVTAPYAKGSDYPGIEFSIQMKKPSGELQPLTMGSVTYESKKPQSSGRMPITLVRAFPLMDTEFTVYAYWKSIRKSECIIDDYCAVTLTACLAEGFF